MKFVFKKAVIFLCAVTLLVGIVSCSSKQTAGHEHRKIRLAYIPITHSLTLMALDSYNKDNKDKAFDVELVKYGSWPELIDALNTGKVDGASALLELAVKSKEQGSKIKAVALGHHDGNVVVVANDINSVQELKGKSFAIPSKLSTHYILLSLMLKNAGMTLSDVKVVELPPPEMPAALFEGRISGYCVAEPFGAKSVASNKGKVLYDLKDIWEGSICCALIFRDEFISTNADLVQQFMQEYVKYGKEISQDKQKEMDILAKYMSIDSKTIEKSLEWISYDNLKIQSDEYNTLIKHMTELKLVENPPSFSDFVDNSFIDKVK